MNKRIGIVGGGQLGRMLAQAAKKFGFGIIILDPDPHCLASEFADRMIVKSLYDAEGMRELSKVSDIITFEFESLNIVALEELALEGSIIYPSPKSLSLIKDKYHQKIFLQEHSIPVAPFFVVQNKDDIVSAIREFGYPILLKSRFDAYNGLGNALIRNESEIDIALKKLANENLYVEKHIPFIKELAVIVARNTLGEMITFPVVETIHENYICHLVIAPAQINSHLTEKAEKLAIHIISLFKGVGVFAVEMFLTADGGIMVNEIALRVHNSGHCTVEAHQTSQFEQHIRAITGMPLGNTNMKTPYAVMINILGERTGLVHPTGVEEALKIPGVSVHIYGKIHTRPERKMGHITVIGSDLNMTIEKAKLARSKISI